MRNAFNSVDTAALTPAGKPHRLDECISSDRKARRGSLDPKIHDGWRVAGPPDEVAAKYQVIYNDELEDGDFAASSNDSQADRADIAASGIRAKSSDYFPHVR